LRRLRTGEEKGARATGQDQALSDSKKGGEGVGRRVKRKA